MSHTGLELTQTRPERNSHQPWPGSLKNSRRRIFGKKISDALEPKPRRDKVWKKGGRLLKDGGKWSDLLSRDSWLCVCVQKPIEFRSNSSSVHSVIGNYVRVCPRDRVSNNCPHLDNIIKHCSV